MAGPTIRNGTILDVLPAFNLIRQGAVLGGLHPAGLGAGGLFLQLVSAVASGRIVFRGGRWATLRVAWLEGAFAGFVLVRETSAGVREIVLCAVRAECRGQGVGRRLILSVLDETGPDGVVEAVCPPGAEAMKHVLAGLGFEPGPREASGERFTLRQTASPSLDQRRAVAALFDAGRMGEVEPLARWMTERFPRDAFGWKALGLMFKNTGRSAEALAPLQTAAALVPDDADTLNTLGVVFGDLDCLDEAEENYRNALGINPDNALAHNNLGSVLHRMGRLEEAEASFRQALRMAPDDADMHANLGVALHDQGRLDEAQASCLRALALQPDYAIALLTMGQIKADTGAFEEAEALFLRALEVQPDMPEAWAELISVRKGSRDDTEWLAAVEGLVRRGLPAGQESHLRFALGKYFNDVGDFDRAFEHYSRANDLRKSLEEVYEQAEFTSLVDRIVAGQSPECARRLGLRVSESARPLFIVGMPRSGTSLVEQILASHPAVFGAGELGFWKDAVKRLELGTDMEAWQGVVLRTLAEEYLGELERLSADALRVVDKMPSNYLFLGLIHAVFPNARILHTQRNPIDTCLSNYFQDFKFGHAFTNDLSDLAHNYREYHRLMTHWRALLPQDRLLDVPYEALVADQEAWSRKIVAFAGLEWDERCLDFHATERKVGTASNWQVRQKIYTSSTERWRKYERHLGPLRELLELP